MPAAKLRVVAPDEPVETIRGSAAEAPAPIYAYEHEERRRIMAKDWSRVHVTGDRAPAFHWFPQALRTWRA